MKWIAWHRVELALGLALAILGASVLVSHRSTAELDNSINELNQVIETRAKLADLLKHLLDAETGRRGYLITGEEAYLASYEGSLKEIDEDMKELAQLVRRAPETMRQFDALGSLIAAKYKEMNDTIEARKTVGFESASQMVLTNQGKVIMDDIRHVIDGMVTGQKELQRQHSTERLANTRATTSAVDFAALLAALIAGLSAGIHHHDSRRRRQAERGLRETTQLLQAIVDNAPLAIISFSDDFKVRNWNLAAQQMFGWTAQEVIGQPLPTVQVEAQAEALSLFERVRREGRIANVETQCLRKDGSLIDVSISAAALRDAGGHVIGVTSIVTDISERKRAERRTQLQMERLTALRAIDTAITGSLDLHLTLDLLLEQAVAQLRVDAAAILLLNPHAQTLEWAAGRGFRTNGIRRSHLRIGEGIAGRAALEQQAVNLSNLAEAGDAYTRRSLLAGEEFVAYRAVPLLSKGQVKGVLEVFHRAPLEPDPEWLNYIEVLAGQAAIAIENTELFRNLRRLNVELTLTYDTTIDAWSRALDLRDKETLGHSQRVTEMTMQLARIMGIDEAKLAHVRRGALLHDIGKMGIPDSILLKPGPLTDEEWTVMRHHPVYAYELLSPIAFFHPAIEIPYCHHEKWDGTGYPRGLKGEQIPLAARIFAVADVWDALRSDRPYRAPWAREKVLEHILSLAGTHFDPKVVEEFVRLDPEALPPLRPAVEGQS